VVGAKALRQTGRYVDDNAAVESGRRLRLGFFGSRSKVGLVIVIALVVGVGFGVVGVVVFAVVGGVVP
jgi:hypothetical protein